MEKKRINIYHIKRTDEKEYFLKPLMNPKNIINQKTETEIVINYSDRISAEAINSLKNDLYGYADDASRAWIDDLKLIPRFLFSLLSALAVFLLMEFLIPDPIPLADEFLGGIIAGSILNYYLKSRYRKTVPAIRKRLELRTKADSLNYENVSFIRELQRLLNETDGSDCKTAAEKIASARSGAALIPDEHKNCLKEILMNKIMPEKTIRKALDSELNAENICHILELCEKKEIDKDSTVLLLMFI